MITMTRYIDEAKKKLGIKTTAKLAQAIGTQGSYLLRVYHQKATCKDEIAAKLAEITDQDPGEALIIANHATAPDKMKKYYETIYKNYKTYVTKQKQ